MFPLGLEQVADILTGLEGQALVINPLQCSRVRHRRSTCTLCIDHCPAHAITWNSMLNVDTKCNRCGICTALCPTGALEAQNPSNAHLIEQVKQVARGYPSIAFACPREVSRKRSAIVLVNCLGRLDESILLAAVAEGISEIDLVDGACQDCPNATSRDVVEQVVARATGLAQSFGLRTNIRFIVALPEQPAEPTSPTTTDFSRRAFFNLLARETVRATTVTASAVLNHEKKNQPEFKPGEMPQRLPARRQLVLQTMQRLTLCNAKTHESGNWASLTLEKNCTGCEMCAFFCPTGALTKAVQGDQRGVNFRAAYCTNCELCKDICHWDAVRLSTEIDLSKVIHDQVEILLFPESGKEAWAASLQDKMKRLAASLFEV